MTTAALRDGFGRGIHNVRLSITDRCNMRCTYCMPKNPVWIPREEVLTYEELLRLARIFVSLGVWKVRLTGGEPTVRKGIVELVGRIVRVPGLTDVSLTTNGMQLERLAGPLRDAGLRRINVSLDSLDPARFMEITRSDALPRVLAGLEAARRAGFDPIKVNFVAVRGLNDDEVTRVAEFGRREGYEIRFIEFMPLDGDRAWGRGRVLSKREILEAIGARFPYASAERDPHAPAERFRYRDGAGTFGVIGSVTEPFCGRCDRVRVTADGKFRTCLFAARETDLRAELRGGAPDERIAERIAAAVAGKEAGHRIGAEGFEPPERAMNRIGG